MGVTFSVSTLIGIYLCTAQIGGMRAGIIAAFTWVFINADIFTEANQPNTEVITNAVSVWAFALAFSYRHHKSTWLILCSGLLFFLVTTIKHFLLVIPLLSAAGTAAFYVKQRYFRRYPVDSDDLRAWFQVGAVILLSWMLLLFYFHWTDRFWPLVNGLFSDSLKYAASRQGGILENMLQGLTPARLLPWFHLPFLPLYSGLLIAVAWGVLHTNDSRWGALLGWIAGVWLSVSASGRFFPHYYMLWLPLLSIGTGLLFSIPFSSVRQNYRKWIFYASVFILCLVAFRQFAQLIRYDAADSAISKYGELGEIFTETKDLGIRIREEIREENIFELGGSGIYFYANARPPAPYVDSLYCAGDSDMAKRCAAVMLDVLLKNPPALLVTQRLFLDAGEKDGRSTLLKNYLSEKRYVELPGMGGKHLTVLKPL
jgi:hypothetical protein